MGYRAREILASTEPNFFHNLFKKIIIIIVRVIKTVALNHILILRVIYFKEIIGLHFTSHVRFTL